MSAGVSQVDLLAIGPHPDDIEIGIGGIVAKHAALGHRVGLCDLTAGEMGSNGTVDERLAEADAARAVLGARWRMNLRLPDRAIGGDAGHVRVVASLIRRAKPTVVALPYWADRHPDHVAASQLLTEGVFSAALRRYPAEGDAWKAESVWYYFLTDAAAPSVVVDVSEHYETKRKALACHASQFQRTPTAAATRLNTPLFNQLVEIRDAQFGALAGVARAEGIVVREPILRSGLLKSLP